ncbi:MAG TPA: DUF2877 domain-containing protein [Bellilinea sp.]|nr:DUF2877 domain-containing protein [Bellilinea sp.]
MSTDETHIDCLTTDRFRPEFSLEARTIGLVAANALKVDRPFTIRGITSRGIFVDLDEKLILFLSREDYRGPLTVNMTWDEAVFDQIEVKAVGRVCSTSLRFVTPNMAINTGHAAVWSALDTWGPTALPAELPINDQIICFLDSLLSHSDSDNELIDAIVHLLSPASPPPGSDKSDLLNAISIMHQALRQQDLSGLEKAAHALAGRGRGLTPSGDDFLLGICYGLFMAQTRFPKFYQPAGMLLSKKVSQRSTLISANLVDCAAAGEVDERLGAAFQALLYPQNSAGSAIDGILSWGSSSGMDATAGMAHLLSAIR